MWIVGNENRKRTMVILAGMAGLIIMLNGSDMALSAEDDWLDAMMRAVLVEQMNEGALGRVYEPYMAQLEVIQAHYRRGDVAATYAGMNQFMGMLEHRANGIPGVSADWLFEYCYAVTPAKYHDVSRHVGKIREYQFRGLIPPVG